MQLTIKSQKEGFSRKVSIVSLSSPQLKAYSSFLPIRLSLAYLSERNWVKKWTRKCTIKGTVLVSFIDGGRWLRLRTADQCSVQARNCHTRRIHPAEWTIHNCQMWQQDGLFMLETENARSQQKLFLLRVSREALCQVIWNASGSSSPLCKWWSMGERYVPFAEREPQKYIFIFLSIYCFDKEVIPKRLTSK